MSAKKQEYQGLGHIVNEIEETAIAVILAAMTIITFRGEIPTRRLRSGRCQRERQ